MRVHSISLSSVYNKMLGKSNYALLSVFWKTIYMSKSNNLFPKKNAVAAVAGKRVNCLWNLLDVLPMLCMNVAALNAKARTVGAACAVVKDPLEDAGRCTSHTVYLNSFSWALNAYSSLYLNFTLKGQ